MRIAFVNMSARPEITHALLQQIADAIDAQMMEDAAPMWQAAPVAIRVAPSLDGLPADTAPIAIIDKPDQPGAEGWHSYKSSGLAYGECSTDTVLDNGGTLTKGSNSLSVLMSHEALETAFDPYTSWLAMVDDTHLEWLEVCDRVEADSYEKLGISVSNFLGPRAFRDGPGPYDKMELLTSPWELRPGGYVDRLNLTTGQVDTSWGHEMLVHRRHAKARSPRRSRRFAMAQRIAAAAAR